MAQIPPSSFGQQPTSRKFGKYPASVVTDVHQLEIIENSTVKWPAIFAGIFITLLTYAILITLGVAIGSNTLRAVYQGVPVITFGLKAGVWLVLSNCIALFVGAYCTARVSGKISVRVGRSQGAVIAALLFAAEGFGHGMLGFSLGLAANAWLGLGILVLGTLFGVSGGGAGAFTNLNRPSGSLAQRVQSRVAG